jgi:hypothetical protein
MEFTFTVGEAETHTVRFQYSSGLTATVRIDVDGIITKKNIFRIRIPASRCYEFQGWNNRNI